MVCVNNLGKQMKKELNSMVRSIVNDHKGGQVEYGRDFGRELMSALCRKGFRNKESYSYCKVATFETNLTDGKHGVHIVSSYWDKAFTDVNVYEE